MTKQVLGHIDCPVCKTTKGMRITHDKNSDPFGFCEAKCGQQLRIGGNKHRVDEFLKHHPWAAAKPVTGTEPNPVQVPVQKPEPAPAAKQAKKGWLTPLMS